MEEMVYQLWYAVIGSNGDGLASQVRDTKERVEVIEKTLPTLLSREDHECADEEKRERVERRKMSTREKAMLVATFLGSFAAIAAVIVAIVALSGSVA